MTAFFTHTFQCICFLLLIYSKPLVAQNLPGNEWIDTSRPYLRISVVRTGMYQLSVDELDAAGVPAESIAAASFQMFRGGREIAIETTTDPQGQLGSEGYIRFFGEKNDGTYDSSLYIQPARMLHSYYSLYSDTAAYFLTWNAAQTGLRVMEPAAYVAADTIGFHFKTQLEIFNSHYWPGKFYPPGSDFSNGTVLSSCDDGEGWGGPPVYAGNPFVTSIKSEDPLIEKSDQAWAEFGVTSSSPEMQILLIFIRKNGKTVRELVEINIGAYQSRQVKVPLTQSDLSGSGEFAFSFSNADTTGSISVSYVKVHYPQSSEVGTMSQDLFYFDQKTEDSFWKTSLRNIEAYDCTNADSVRKLRISEKGVFLSGSRMIWAGTKFLNVASLRLIRFESIDPSKIDYLIITHPAVRTSVNGADPVQAYADYRASKAGGSYRPLIINSQDVFDQFGYGMPGPMGIKNLISWLAAEGQLKTVFLIGRSADPQTVRKVADARQLDMVPNAGWPGSDIALTTGPDGLPRVPIGRLNAFNARQVYDYLQKVKAFEAEPPAAEWRKNVLHLSGGRSRDELRVFKDYVNSFERKVKGSFAGLNVQSFYKKSDDPTEHFALYPYVNQGAALITLFGHSGLDMTDLDIGQADDPAGLYQNHPRYPALIVNGCSSGSIFYSANTLSQNWILAPGSGAVIFLAHTFNGFSTALKKYTETLYEVLADPEFTSAPFGKIQNETIRRTLTSSPNIIDITTAQQMLLHGDPAIRIFPAIRPDYALDAGGVHFQDASTGKQPAAGTSNVQVRLILKNNGRYRDEMLALRVKMILGTDSVTVWRQDYPAMAVVDTVFFLLKDLPLGASNAIWEFSIDPENQLQEENETNNLIQKWDEQTVFSEEKDQVPPGILVQVDGRQLKNNDYVSSRPLIDILLFDDRPVKVDTSLIMIWLRKVCDGCREMRVYLANATSEMQSANSFLLKMTLPYHLETGVYELAVSGFDQSRNTASLYSIRFRIGESPALLGAGVSPNPALDWFRFDMECSGLPVQKKCLLTITDLAGRIRDRIHFDLYNGKNEHFWYPGDLPAGVYCYQLSLEDESVTILSGVKQSLRGRLLWLK